MDRILLVDVHALFYRAFFALPEMTTTRGEPTSALYGFATLMLKLLREERPAAGAFVVDLPGPTFRHRAFPGYKGSRPRAPSPLARQLARLPELLAGFGWPIHSAEGFEGDDVLATLAGRLAADGAAPLVVTGDHDCLQLAGGPTQVLIVARATTRAETYDAERVVASYGVTPAQIPDWIALVGDPTDDLPGLPGVGARTAARWIGAHGGVDGILAAVDRLEPARLREVVRTQAASLRLWRDLATLRDDVPLADGPLALPLHPEARAQLRRLFAELEFRSLMPRLDSVEESSAPG